jgi:hypothetical protein
MSLTWRCGLLNRGVDPDAAHSTYRGTHSKLIADMFLGA